MGAATVAQPRAGVATQLRCPGNNFGLATGATGHLRVQCRDRYCRVRDRATFHTFDLATGEFTTAHEAFRPISELLNRLED